MVKSTLFPRRGPVLELADKTVRGLREAADLLAAKPENDEVVRAATVLYDVRDELRKKLGLEGFAERAMHDSSVDGIRSQLMDDSNWLHEQVEKERKAFSDSPLSLIRDVLPLVARNVNALLLMNVFEPRLLARVASICEARRRAEAGEPALTTDAPLPAEEEAEPWLSW
ncbi:MAG: hypothetical protein RLZZ324_82 [Candidatus Parcubacteria bacterium]|jgi:hypothetical protein